MPTETFEALHAQIAELRAQLVEAQEALEAIRTGQVESLVIEGPNGPSIFSLEETNFSYRVLVEAISEGAVTMGEDGVVLYCNARFAEMLRAPLQQVMGNPLRRWIPGRWRSTFEALLRHDSDTNGRGELGLRANDGTEVRTHLSISTINDDGRRVYCLVATELGAQERSEQEAGAANDERPVVEPAEVVGSAPAPVVPESQVRTLATMADQFEKDYLLQILAVVKGRRGRCAELLGISRRSLWLKLRKHGIARSDASS